MHPLNDKTVLRQSRRVHAVNKISGVGSLPGHSQPLGCQLLGLRANLRRGGRSPIRDGSEGAIAKSNGGDSISNVSAISPFAGLSP